jgi:hypothetical protein
MPGIAPGIRLRRTQMQLAAHCKKPADHSAGFCSLLTKQQEQDDQGNRNSDEPEKNGHVISFQLTG